MDKTTKTAEWILRIGIFGAFLGHGIFALGVKQSWIPLMTAFGFSEVAASTLLPFIGIADILVAFLALLALQGFPKKLKDIFKVR